MQKSIKTDILVINDWKSSEIITTPERVDLVWYIGFWNFKLIFFHILWQFETIGFMTLKLVIWKCIKKTHYFQTSVKRRSDTNSPYQRRCIANFVINLFWTCRGKREMKQLGTGLPVSNVVVHYENYQWTPWPSNLYCKIVKR